jgi:hypothetical protein
VVAVWFPGTVSTGGVSSATVTLKLRVSVPPALVAEQLTVVSPSGKREPVSGLQVAVGAGVGSSASLTV